MWVATWADALDGVHRDLRRCLAALPGPGDPYVELTRRWLSVDWTIRAAAPRWLRSAGLSEHATKLRQLTAVGSTNHLVAAADTVKAARNAAIAAHQTAWYQLTQRAHLDDPDRRQLWPALVAGGQTAMRCAWVIIEPVTRISGYGTQPDRGPTAWCAAVEAITHSAAAITWHAIGAMISRPTWSWHQPPTEARALAHTTARCAVAPVDAAVHGSMSELFANMLTIPTSLPNQ